jgi:hypothetical protein
VKQEIARSRRQAEPAFRLLLVASLVSCLLLVSSFSFLPASGGFSQFTSCFLWFLTVSCLLLVVSRSFLLASSGVSQFAACCWWFIAFSASF